MALSKQDESIIAQHYLVCGTKNCERNCQIYCNDCHQPMCEQCKNEHQKSPDTKNHEMVPYQQRKIQLPVEKCEDHPTKDVDMICRSGRLWVSDNQGNLVQTDQKGNLLQKIQTRGEDGYHTVTLDGDLLYTDKDNKVIKRVTDDNIITEFNKTGDWEPISIHSSNINGDILVGMVKDGEAKVTRYDKTGTEIQNIQRDNKGQELYSNPNYITENINGDICTSDCEKQAVVVVGKSGQHRFSFTYSLFADEKPEEEDEFEPNSIYTNTLGHILVCDTYCSRVHFLDQDGHGLFSLLFTSLPLSVCVDEENNFHVGKINSNTVTVCKYLR
uniref:Uncharacterized protein n=1 Tax=Magallana gigas TaxID=29159 RepID=K1QI21_MAGGI